MEEKNTKPWYKSRMIWTNVLVCISGISIALSDYVASGGTITGIGILNIMLRAITNSSLSFK